MSSNQKNDFEMFALRKDLLGKIAEMVRKDEISRAKMKGAHMIRRRAESDNPVKLANTFKTSFENALDIVRGNSEKEIEIESARERILQDTDAEIDPQWEIDGDVVEIIISKDSSGFSTNSSEYPVVNHPSGYRVCTCPSQRYHIVCKHTLARVIERNWPKSTLPNQ